jgi:acyl-CoA thioester hydrolase
MTGLPIYRTGVAAEWIDYNGHLRDAYYVLISSYATDALMDRIGIDASYRKRTRCTLYTLEIHIHYLREVKRTDEVSVDVRIIAADHQRIHAALDLMSARHPEPVASAEIMLLHVAEGEKPVATAFPPDIGRAIEALKEATAALPASGPGSRRMLLRSR